MAENNNFENSTAPASLVKRLVRFINYLKYEKYMPYAYKPKCFSLLVVGVNNLVSIRFFGNGFMVTTCKKGTIMKSCEYCFEITPKLAFQKITY